MTVQRSLIFCALLLVAAPPSVWAVDPAKHISQYGHSTWRISDGFLGAAARVVTQTRDGYLWIGTENGVLRFDGVRFVPFVSVSGTQLPSGNVLSLLAARDGTLWIGTSTSLSHWTQSRLVNYSEEGIFTGLVEDSHGTVWVARSHPSSGGGPALCEVLTTRMRCHGSSEGVSLFNAFTVSIDSRDEFWIAGDTGILHGRPGAFVSYAPSGLKRNQGFTGITAIAEMPDNSVWIGMDVAGPGLGLQRLAKGVWSSIVTPELNSSRLRVHSMLVDHEQALWVGTVAGLYRIIGNTVDHFAAIDGLSGNYVTGLFEDREGNIWAATADGLDCFHNVRVSTISTREGLNSDEVNSVFASRDGTLWISGENELDALRGDRVVTVRKPPQLPGTTVTTVFEDHAGRLWVGADRTLSIYEQGKFTPVNGRDGRPVGLVVGMAEDTDQNVWVEVSGTPRTLLRIRGRTIEEEFPAPEMPAARKVAADPRGGIWLGLMSGDLARYRNGRLETFAVAHGPPPSWIHQLAVNADGSVWAAAAFGLVGWKDGRSDVLTVRNGLPCDNVNAFVEDDRGALWLYTECGLVQIPQAELRRWWEDPSAILQMKSLDATDGVRPGYAPFQGAARTSDGRLWFANSTGLQMVDPARLEGNTLPPPVIVEAIVADQKRYARSGIVDIPPLPRDLEIDYTATSFGAPQRGRFRYRLEGRDTAWQDAGTRRQALYSDLRPGHYRFRVKGSNGDGVWNEEGASVDFNVLPAWYQTMWFRALTIAAGICGIVTLYQLRLRQLSAQFNRGLEARVQERTRIARDLHDTLLQSVHALLIHTQAAANLLPMRPDEARERLENVIDRTSQAIAEGRDAVQDLRSSSSGTSDLSRAISVLSAELTAGDDVPQPVIRVNVEGTPRDLRPALRDDVYRITAEALRNAVHHAEAHLVQVDVRYDNRQLQVCIHDNGRGMAPDVIDTGTRMGHWGLAGMRERAEVIGGRFELHSQLGSGTRITLRIPAGTAYEAPVRRSWFFSKKIGGDL